jgi:Leucine-rich repeat (LRR) protein
VLLAIATTANAFLVQRDVEVIKSMMVSMPGLTRPELNYKWDPKHPEQACSWKAVVCYPEDPNGAQEIYRLKMTGSVEGGSFPQNIGDLKSLWNLELRQTGFKGPLPDSIKNLTKMRYLVVKGADLRRLPDILAWKELKSVIIQEVTLEQPFLPEDWPMHEKMTELRLSDNGLQGTIPASWEYTLVEHLDLSHNNLKGPLPGFKGAPYLRFLFLNDNRLSGTIPTSVGRKLWQVDLSSNLLTGTIPSEYIFWIVNLSNNSLTGTIPNVFETGDHSELDLSHNKLTGTIPPGVIGSLLNVILDDNSLTLCPGPAKPFEGFGDCDVSNQKGSSACSCAASYGHQCKTGCPAKPFL